MLDRRDFLGQMSGGLGSTARLHLLHCDGLLDAGEARPVAKAKRAVQITLVGGLSHVDSFDHKPELAKRHGQSLKTSTPADTFFGQIGLLRKNDWDFRRRGKSGLW